MWDELLRDLARFPDAVLSGLDGSGRPASIRGRPRPDHANRTLLFAVAPVPDLTEGPASVLCHSHDAALWRLRSFLVRGTLATTADGWAFTPTARVPGTGMAGPVGDLRGFVAARRRAGRYLQRRSLPRPVIPWTHFRKPG